MGLRIEEYNLGDELISLRARGLSMPKIAEELTKKLIVRGKGDIITTRAVECYLKGERTARTRVLAESNKYQEKRLEDYFNLVEELNELKTLLWNTVQELQEKGRFEKIQPVAATILEQLKMVAKMLGQLSENKPTFQINYLDFSQRINQYLPELERQGYIKILKPVEAIEIKEERECKTSTDVQNVVTNGGPEIQK